MDFDLKLAQSEIKECEKAILGGEFSQMPYLGAGSESKVARYKTLAVKQYNNWVDKKISCGLIEKSEKAIEKGYDCAPYLASVDIKISEFLDIKETKYLIAPYIDGKKMSDGDALDKVIELGQHGIDRYYDTFLGMYGIGLGIDLHPSNFIVTKNAISVIDFLEKDTLSKFIDNKYVQATMPLLLLKNFTITNDGEKKKQFISHIKNVVSNDIIEHATEKVSEYFGC
jgi:hypothetical protein